MQLFFPVSQHCCSIFFREMAVGKNYESCYSSKSFFEFPTLSKLVLTRHLKDKAWQQRHCFCLSGLMHLFSGFATLLPLFFCEMEALNYFEFPAVAKLFVIYLKDKTLQQRWRCCLSFSLDATFFRFRNNVAQYFSLKWQQVLRVMYLFRHCTSLIKLHDIGVFTKCQ